MLIVSAAYMALFGDGLAKEHAHLKKKKTDALFGKEEKTEKKTQ